MNASQFGRTKQNKENNFYIHAITKHYDSFVKKKVLLKTKGT